MSIVVGGGGEGLRRPDELEEASAVAVRILAERAVGETLHLLEGRVAAVIGAAQQLPEGRHRRGEAEVGRGPRHRHVPRVPHGERDETALARMESVLPWVMHMHAQNYAPLVAGSDRMERVALADGVVEYGPLFDMLRANDYEGAVSVEFCAANATDKRAAMAHDYRYLRSL